MIQSGFLFANITNLEDKMIKLTSSISICYFPIYMKFMKPCRKDIKIPFAI